MLRERASGARGRRDGGRRKPARERGRMRRGLVLGVWEAEAEGNGNSAIAGEKTGGGGGGWVCDCGQAWGVWQKKILA